MFSLFEWKKNEWLFVVMVLLAILGVSQLQLRVGQMKARDAQRKADAELVARALNRYHEVYPTLPAAEAGRMVMCGDILDLPCEWGQKSIRDREGVVYLTKLPVDPLSDRGRDYVYEVDNLRQRYRIYVALEYRRDPAWKSNLTSACGSGVQCNWYVQN